MQMCSFSYFFSGFPFVMQSPVFIESKREVSCIAKVAVYACYSPISEWIKRNSTFS